MVNQPTEQQQGVHYSPDGQWWWDGDAWKPAQQLWMDEQRHAMKRGGALAVFLIVLGVVLAALAEGLAILTWSALQNGHALKTAQFIWVGIGAFVLVAMLLAALAYAAVLAGARRLGPPEP